MIEGKLVTICGLTKECASEILEWVNQPQLRQFTGTLFPVSEYEHELWMKARAESKTDKLFLIKDKASNHSIGTIGLKNIDYVNQNAELFISIGNSDFVSQIGGGYTQRLWK